MRWVATNPSPLFPKCAKCATYEGTETNLEDVEVILPKFYNLHDQNFQAPTRLQILMYKFTGLDFFNSFTQHTSDCNGSRIPVSLFHLYQRFLNWTRHIVNIFIQMFPSSPFPLYCYNWMHSNNICLRRRKYGLQWIKVF